MNKFLIENFDTLKNNALSFREYTELYINGSFNDDLINIEKELINKNSIKIKNKESKYFKIINFIDFLIENNENLSDFLIFKFNNLYYKIEVGTKEDYIYEIYSFHKSNCNFIDFRKKSNSEKEIIFIDFDKKISKDLLNEIFDKKLLLFEDVINMYQVLANNDLKQYNKNISLLKKAEKLLTNNKEAITEVLENLNFDLNHNCNSIILLGNSLNNEFIEHKYLYTYFIIIYALKNKEHKEIIKSETQDELITKYYFTINNNYYRMSKNHSNNEIILKKLFEIELTLLENIEFYNLNNLNNSDISNILKDINMNIYSINKEINKVLRLQEILNNEINKK